MKRIQVVAALIMREGAVLATQRGYGEYAGGWEFPGGKVEPGETPEEALAREIKEELLVDIAVGEFFYQVEYDYPSFHLSMGCYLCSLPDQEITLQEHSAARWLKPEELDTVDWLPADIQVVEELRKRL